MSDGRTLHVDGLHNARDLGGVPLRGGGTTPRWRVFRSESVDRVRADGWRSLHAAGVRTVVDLRAPAERAADTGTRPGWLTTIEVDHDGRDDAPAFWEPYWETGLVCTPLYYGAHLAALPERTAAALAAIADAPPGGVLLHCAAGRDRTGIVALALLSIAGAAPEGIVDDYLLSVETAPALAGSLGAPDPEHRIEALCAAHGTTVEGAFRAVVDGFDVDRFVERSGLDADRLEALRSFRAHLA